MLSQSARLHDTFQKDDAAPNTHWPSITRIIPDLFPPFPKLSKPWPHHARPKGYRRPTWRALPEGDLLQQGFKSNKVPEDQNQRGWICLSLDPTINPACFNVDDMSCQWLARKTRCCFSQPSHHGWEFRRIWISLSLAVVWVACGWPLHWRNAVIKSWSWNSSSPHHQRKYTGKISLGWVEPANIRY